MSKDSVQIEQINGKNLGFSEFWQTIASEIGNSRLKINPHAESIRYFLDPESDHRDFLRTLIHLSYKRCKCYHLNAPFDVNVALDILGETNYRLQGSKEDDLLDVELLEEIAWLVNQNYRHLIRMPKSILSRDEKEVISDNSLVNRSDKKEASKRKRIVSLSNLKMRKANKKL